MSMTPGAPISLGHGPIWSHWARVLAHLGPLGLGGSLPIWAHWAQVLAHLGNNIIVFVKLQGSRIRNIRFYKLDDL